MCGVKEQKAEYVTTKHSKCCLFGKKELPENKPSLTAKCLMPWFSITFFSITFFIYTKTGWVLRMWLNVSERDYGIRTKIVWVPRGLYN